MARQQNRRDWYWNGCANRVEQGLEISLIGVVDVETQIGYALSAQQTFAQADLPDLTRMEQYLYHLDTARCELPDSVKYLAVDGAYAKENFITGAVHLQLHVISKLRCDANLRWLYTGEQKPRGRRRKYDGKVKLTTQERLSFVECVQPDVDLYTAVVFHVSLRRNIRLAYLLDRSNPLQPRFVVVFSTLCGANANRHLQTLHVALSNRILVSRRQALLQDWLIAKPVTARS